ncbi:MAG: EamA family transporter RarD [Aquabacterium sp.]|nr:EamA family transporter RarD [Aquabacterium sp.]
MHPSHGIPAAALAYILWGLFPLYIKQVAHVPALEVVAHRSLWSLVFMVVLLLALRRLDWVRDVIRQPRVLGVTLVSALLLSTNWLVYVWAVAHDRVLDASLGYFINPLVNVMLGYAVLHERPRPVQWLAVALAGAGVAWLTLGAGTLPWVALALAGSFGVYGLLRKTAPLGAMEGLALETALLAPLALVLASMFLIRGDGAFLRGDAFTDIWLLLAGPFTAIPLLLFAAGARRVTLATMGLLQYLGPSLQFLLGVFVYHEPFDPARALGFVLIWSALVVYSAEGLWQRSRATAA